MNDLELYKNILGIKVPWIVASVQLDLNQKTITIKVEHDHSFPANCPVCNGKATIYDHTIRRWRHLDTCQMTTIIECVVPRVSCDEHGVKQVDIPWAEARSHFTALFEALVINWLKETSLS